MTTVCENSPMALGILGEQALISAVWSDPVAFEAAADRVSAADFYLPEHGVIWSAICELAADNRPFDAVATIDHLRSLGKIEAAGGPDGIARLAQSPGSTHNAAHYADKIREAAELRSLASACGDIAEDASAGHPEAMQKASDQLAAILEGRGQVEDRPVDNAELLRSALERIDEQFTSGTAFSGLRTGFDDLDKRLQGLQAGKLYVLAGRPGMGKSSLAQAIHANVADAAQYPSLFFSLEMEPFDLALRQIARHGVISLEKLTDMSQMRQTDFQRLIELTERDSALNQMIFRSAATSVADISLRARKAHRQHGGLTMIVVDYLQIIASTMREEYRVSDIGKMTRSLRELGKSLQCPVLLLSQLNRQLENRPNKRPAMADLRDSGTIEQDADVVMFVYRDEVYNENTPEPGVAEVIFAKNRQGRPGTVKLMWDGPHCTFRPLAQDYQQQIASEQARRLEAQRQAVRNTDLSEYDYY